MNAICMSRVWREPARLMLFLCLLLGTASAWALDIPTLTGHVVDLAHALPVSTVDSLTAKLKAHEATTSNQIAVFVLSSLEGEPLEVLSHRVSTTWKLGQKGTDNGVLLLVAMKERKIRLEVGYGLEGALTDARSAQIIRNEIVPRFRAGDVPGGVAAGVDAVLKTIEGTYQSTEKAVPAQHSDVVGQVVIAVIVGLIVGLGLMKINRLLGPVAGTGLSIFLAPWLVPALITGGVTLSLLALIGAGPGARGLGRRGGYDGVWYSSRSGGWGGGSFGSGGDSFSGGGGDFGGGGASGNW